GTLTRGEFRVVEITTHEGLAHDRALALAAAIERDSEHTIAQGIVKSAQERGLSIPTAQGFQAIPGQGVQAAVDPERILVGGPVLLRAAGAVLEPVLQEAVLRASTRGQTAITMVVGGSPVAVFALADAVRQESAEAVRRLHEHGIEVIMMTGDARAVANA